MNGCLRRSRVNQEIELLVHVRLVIGTPYILAPSGTCARSLHSDRAWLELGRYVATERDVCSVATWRPSLARARSLRGDRVTFFGVFSDVSCFFRRALHIDSVVTDFDPNTLFSSCLECSLSLSFKFWNSEESSGLVSSRGLGSPNRVFLRQALVGWSRLNSSIFRNMEGSPYRKFSLSQGKGRSRGPDPENSIAGNQGSSQRGTRGRCPARGLEEFNP
ncbi:hypothetical protein F2Q69_00006776 [Brassica cretica]|uniref:Uncharacterized protein n=1 Tax=Brassica cretica TaxID=69181 RepID=A0A8S9PC02_BRACR|nr:hypothetical protein F2Q69_00006776 [Brassica cretica]